MLYSFFAFRFSFSVGTCRALGSGHTGFGVSAPGSRIQAFTPSAIAAFAATAIASSRDRQVLMIRFMWKTGQVSRSSWHGNTATLTNWTMTSRLSSGGLTA